MQASSADSEYSEQSSEQDDQSVGFDYLINTRLASFSGRDRPPGVIPVLEKMVFLSYWGGRDTFLGLPALETLELAKSYPVLPPMTQLRELSITEAEEAVYLPMVPNLEVLTLYRVNLMELPELPKLRKLCVGQIPHSITLPRYPMLESLTMLNPLMANGRLVHTLEQYRAAWGRTSN